MPTTQYHFLALNQISYHLVILPIRYDVLQLLNLIVNHIGYTPSFLRKLNLYFVSVVISLNRDAYKTNVYAISHHLVCFLQCQYYKDACFMSIKITRMCCKNVATIGCAKASSFSITSHK